jgi:hypothetical protein
MKHFKFTKLFIEVRVRSDNINAETAWRGEPAHAELWSKAMAAQFGLALQAFGEDDGGGGGGVGGIANGGNTTRNSLCATLRY